MLLILSIANNFIMYNKCYISKHLITYDGNLKTSIGFQPINIYYPYGPDNEKLLNEIKLYLSNLQAKNKMYVTYGLPLPGDYDEINNM